MTMLVRVYLDFIAEWTIGASILFAQVPGRVDVYKHTTFVRDSRENGAPHSKAQTSIYRSVHWDTVFHLLRTRPESIAEISSNGIKR
jgi:hypothetical protein